MFSKFSKNLVLSVLPLTLMTTNCATTNQGRKTALIKHNYRNGQIEKLCDQYISETEKSLNQLVQSKEKRTFENTILAFETILADFSTKATPLSFMSAVSPKESTRKSSESCEVKLGEYSVGIVTRRDLYKALSAAYKATKWTKRPAVDKRLAREILDEFEKSGMSLSDSKLKEMRKLLKRLNTVKTKFGNNLGENTDSVAFTKEELKGLPESILKQYKKDSKGRYIVTTKFPDYYPVMQNVESSETRRKLTEKYVNRESKRNTKLLNEALMIRRKVAKLLGYKTWADYRTSNYMAKNSSKALRLLKDVQKRIKKRYTKDVAAIKAFQKEVHPDLKKLNIWDMMYYGHQLRKRDYTLNEEEIREYFPANQTIKGMFDIFSTLFQVKFEEVRNPDVWAKGVKLYAVKEKNGKLVGHFYADLYPRKGKYGHFAMFPIRQGRQDGDKWITPLAAIVANFSPPSGDKPSLLKHSEVETLFHEFGHVLHHIFSTSPYASLAGTNTPQDFVEAPSQMLEQWVWKPELLKNLSGHYKNPSKKLPSDIIKRMISARNFNRGYHYTRQLIFGIFDLTIHTSRTKIDPITTYRKLFKNISGMSTQSNSHFPATFGHIMGGYDAGYYSYIWSEVFAEDMFTQFEKSGLKNPATGKAYREKVLAMGNTEDPEKFVSRFLKRKPSTKPFFDRLNR